jgi:hypothetical protein
VRTDDIGISAVLGDRVSPRSRRARSRRQAVAGETRRLCRPARGMAIDRLCYLGGVHFVVVTLNINDYHADPLFAFPLSFLPESVQYRVHFWRRHRRVS